MVKDLCTDELSTEEDTAKLAKCSTITITILTLQR